ncbi:MAG: prolyl oligopeptidase family serine peptidase, partial [Candidatus Aegiribacteria sp.]|nr:prolyl oligopeptidase family serine peptidase [Candidatus Aegiribacteria sp.]
MKSRFIKPEELVYGIRPISGFSLSPDGESVAYSQTVDEDSRIFISDFDRSKPFELSPRGGSSSMPRWSPQESRIAFIHADEKGISNLYLTKPSGDDTRKLAEFRNGSFGAIEWSADGQYLALTSTHEGALDLYVINPDRAGLNRITSGLGRVFYPKWSPDGKRLLFFNATRPAGGKYGMKLVNLDGTGLRTIGPAADRNAYGSWSPDGSKIVFHSNANGSVQIGILDFRTEEVAWITGDDRDHRCPVWFPDGDRIAFLTEIDGSTRVFIADIVTRKTRIIGPEAGLCHNLEVARDGRRIVFIHEGAGNPASLCSQVIDGKVEQLTDSLPKSLSKDDFVFPEEVRYTSSDGLEIPALLYRPKQGLSDELPPAVIQLHGGPNYQTYNCWQPRIQLLVNRGYLVLAPQFRGSTGYGREFEQLSKGDWGGGDLQDVISAADWLVSTEQADPAKIALLGGSYGGYLMLMAMAKTPDRWAVGIDLFGFVDLKTFHENASDWMREWIEKQIGSPEQNLDFYSERSPISHCVNIDAPLLILQGENDERVPLAQAKQLRDRMVKRGKECYLKIYK